MIPVAVSMRSRSDDTRISLRNSGDRLSSLQHLSIVPDHPHVQVAELQGIRIRGLELEINQDRRQRMCLNRANELKPRPVTQATL